MGLFNSGSFSGQTVVITGGSKGIGAAAAKKFAQCGATVYIAARNAEKLEAYAVSLREQGLDVCALTCDITDYGSVTAMYDAVIRRSGKIDIVYANAGVLLQKQSLACSDPVLWEQTVQTNLIGSYNTARAVIGYMIENNGGKILFTGSGRGRRASMGLADYACSKAGQWMLVRSLSAELAQYHIAVNEIVPGPVATGMDTEQDSNVDLKSSGEILKQPEDVAELILFVASQSNHTGPTGQTFALNRREL